MKLELGVKSDPIEYRYSYDWFFDLLKRNDIYLVQIGSFFELYSLEDDFFKELREKADKRGVRIKSCFTAHRELGGFFTNNKHLEKTARMNYEKYINAASIMGADYMGSNPGAVYRDQLEYKPTGIECYLKHMKDFQHIAFDKGLKGLTIEPMSCQAEPPTTENEIKYMMDVLNEYHAAHSSSTVPVYICGDISHGILDKDYNLVQDNYSLFEYALPYMVEFHFKNTNKIFSSTFGFSEEEIKDGIIDLTRIKEILERKEDNWPAGEMTGYLEIGGPKTGRDYSDYKLEEMIVSSLNSIKKVFKM